MNEQRFVVTDQVWLRLEPHLPGKASDAGATTKNNRLFMEAVFWRERTGSPWRDPLPARACLHARAGAARLRELEHSVPSVSSLGQGWRIRESFQSYEWCPRPRICAHRRHHRSGPPEGNRRKRGTQYQAIGRSRGGLTTKIVVLVPSHGLLCKPLPGNGCAWQYGPLPAAPWAGA